jgi:uncharacterized protein (TIGR03067 family)
MKSANMLSSLLVLLLVAADGKKENATTIDMKRIQGTWAFVLIEEPGMKKSGRELKGMEDQLHWSFTGHELIRNLGDEPVRGRFQLDGTTQPKEIDLLHYAGKGKTVRGIYAFEGEHLRILLGSSKGERPRAFGPPQSGQVHFLMKRHVVVNKDS